MRRPRDRLMHRLTGRLRERSEGPRRNVALWTGCSLALGASLGMAARIIAPLAEAEHSHDPHYHLGSILRYEDPETTCAKVLDGSASQEAVVAALRDVLDNPSHAAYDWDGTQFVTFRGQVMANECPQRSPQEHIRQYIYVTKTPPCPGSGCQTLWFPYDDPLSGHSGIGMPEYQASEVYIRTGYLTPDVINHEVGHSLGLCDGGPSLPQWDSCAHSGIGDLCTGSVMHVHGCNNGSDWPTDADRFAVSALRYWGGGAGGPPILWWRHLQLGLLLREVGHE